MNRRTGVTHWGVCDCHQDITDAVNIHRPRFDAKSDPQHSGHTTGRSHKGWFVVDNVGGACNGPRCFPDTHRIRGTDNTSLNTVHQGTRYVWLRGLRKGREWDAAEKSNRVFHIRLIARGCDDGYAVIRL